MSGFQPTLALKQGATLALDLFVTDDLGGAVDLSTLTAQLLVFDPLGNPVAALTPVLAGGQMGWATVIAATDAWPIGLLTSELRLTANSVTQISDSFLITIQRPASA